MTRDYFFDFPLTTDVRSLFDGMDIIGPVRGRLAVDVSPDNPAKTEALGSPLRQYVCVRSSDALALPKGAVATDPVLGVSLLGVWCDYDVTHKKAQASYYDTAGEKHVRNDTDKSWSVKAVPA